MWQTARDLWSNFGFAYPVVSTLTIMTLAGCLWWIFGAVVHFTTPKPAPVVEAPAVTRAPRNVSYASMTNEELREASLKLVQRLRALGIAAEEEQRTARERTRTGYAAESR